jgi:hypothetical protein
MGGTPVIVIVLVVVLVLEKGVWSGVDFVDRPQTIVPKGISKVVPKGRNDGSLA